jgi:hypothetical protein
MATILIGIGSLLNSVAIILLARWVLDVSKRKF